MTDEQKKRRLLKGLFNSVYSKLPDDEKKDVDSIVNGWAGSQGVDGSWRRAKIGITLARELLMSIALYLNNDEARKLGYAESSDMVDEATGRDIRF